MNAVFGVRWNDNLKRVPLALMAVALLATSFLSQPGAADALSARAGELVSVIVREQPGAGDAPEHFIESAGGTVTQELGIINGYVASVPRSAAVELEKMPGVHSVTGNGRVQLLSHTSAYEVDDLGTPNAVQEVTGAGEYWNDGITGRGVDVALIDSGVAPVDALAAPGKIVNGADLSFESQSENLRYLDTFGHGTHMAGLIAGRDPGVGPTVEKGDAARHFVGIAPDARIVNVKVADYSGATDVSQVIAAIDWVVQHRRDHGMNIRVLNLSFGTDGTQDYTLDPLTYAAEVAWRKGIVVVAAAGNDGFGTSKLNNPAYDPFVLAVGASDSRGTYGTYDDVVADFSSRGDGTRNPDLLAPGKSIVSLRVPNSYIDVNHPEGRVADRFFRGSGTSQAAAIVSGAAALVLQQRPHATPDQVKRLLTSSAQRLPNADPIAQGQGLIDLKVARDRPSWFSATQSFSPATGTGSLELARGSSHLVDGEVELRGEMDIFGAPWVGATWAPLSLAEASWQGGAWNGNVWTGSSWSNLNWLANRWSANRWSGGSWSGVIFDANRWSGDSWEANRWSANRWSGDTWSANRWSANRWSSSLWGN